MLAVLLCPAPTEFIMLFVLVALFSASELPVDWQRYRTLPDSVLTGAIEIKLKTHAYTVTPTAVLVGNRIAIDLNDLVGADRALFRSRSLLLRARNDRDLPEWLRLYTGNRKMSELWRLVERLNRLPDVELAYPVAKGKPPTPKYPQPELGAAPSGIEAAYTQALPEARGKNVKVGDVEGGWVHDHEDLPLCPDVSVDAPIFAHMDEGSWNHGTAVLGQMVGLPNDFGVTGIAPDASCQTSNTFRYERDAGGNIQFYDPPYQDYPVTDWDVPRAMGRHALTMQAGDVVLLEVHIPGPNTTTEEQAQQQFGFVPAEHDPATFQKTRALTLQGIIVVAAAGNGQQNLDASVYQGRYGAAWGSAQHSGAIMVGAGGSASGASRARLYFSNYGQRVDVQAWGESVTTLGYGDLQGNTPQTLYTAEFAGTSSASPFVTASVAVINGYLKAIGQPVLTSRQLADLLKATGSAQTGNTNEHIGPLVNLKKALAALAICGDGKLAAGEACDDANTQSGDGCSADCTSDESCGNDILDTGEVCDDGNTAAGDGCRADCLGQETCGDGQVDAVKKEVCDDGNKKSGDGCSKDCKGAEVCGDGRLDSAAGEVCDDENEDSGDGCSDDCTSDESCGNGIVDVGEACDDGNTDEDDACNDRCKLIKKAAATPQTPLAPVSAVSGATQSTSERTGCGGCNTTSDGAPALLALALLLAFRRRDLEKGGPRI